MPYFKCIFLDDKGKLEKKILFEDNRETLQKKSLSMEKKLISARRMLFHSASDKKTLHQSVKPSEFLLFNQKLHALLEAGVSFVRALKVIIKNLRKGCLRSIVEKAEEDINNGVPISEAFSYPNIPSHRIYQASLLAGEKSGKLNDILKKYNDYLDKISKLRRKTISSLSYPVVLFTFMIVMVIVVLVFAIPRFAEFYGNFDSEFPDVTLKLIAVGSFLKANFILILSVILIIIFAIKLAEKYSERIVVFDYLKTKIPFLGRVINDNSMSIFSRTLSILISGGIPVPEATGITVETVTNKYYYSKLKDIPDKIKEGNLLSESLQDVPFVPEIMIEIIHVGESSGRLGMVLERNAEYLENAIDSRINTLISLIEPILIIFLGVVIAFMLLAIYLPIFNTVRVVG
jgi:type IV pilus assembly protein PilC